MTEKLYTSASPHLRSCRNTRNIMLDVIIALIPACIAGIIIFGYMALCLICVSVVSCVLAEWICRKVMKRENTIGDLSAVVTGILLALNYPVSLNPLIAVLGSVIAIVIAKQMFGGIGHNFINPALGARVILLTSFSQDMTNWTKPFAYMCKSGNVDAVSTATPLKLAESGSGELPSYLDLFLGIHGGCIGETCILALLIGGIYLCLRRVISPLIPVTYLGTVAVFSLFFGMDPLYQLLSGGVVLGAIFMATDYVTTPMTDKGRFIFALGCGIITMIIRKYGSLPEGVSFSIVLMNILTPLIDRYTKTKPFGFVKAKKVGDDK